MKGAPGRRFTDPSKRRSLSLGPQPVYQAIKNQVDIFLTVDRGVRRRKPELAMHGLRVLSPSEFIRGVSGAS
jgi:hypothetical protein